MHDVAPHSWRGDDDPSFAKLVSGKTVAIVGPARTILGKNQGAHIDAHDLVVRFNDTFDLPSRRELTGDIGTRTDILYCNQVVLRKHILERDRARQEGLLALCDDAGVKWIVCTNNSLSFSGTEPAKGCDRRDVRVIAETEAWLRRGASTARLRVVCTASALLAGWLEGNWGRTGLIGIVDLLTFDTQRLFICGMTFYHGGGHLHAAPDAELHPLKNRDGTWARSPDGVGHDSYRELEVMKVLARCFRGRLETDAALAALISPQSP